MPSSLCRAAKKPTKAKWLLGDEYKMELDIEYNGIQPRAAWRMSDKIHRWGITWRDSMATNPNVSLGINGNVGSAIMMSHGMTLLAMSEVKDEVFAFALVALLAVQPIKASDGDDDYICRAPLLEECPQHHGHKGDPGVRPGTCGAIGERAQVILVWVRAPGCWERLPPTETRSHEG